MDEPTICYTYSGLVRIDDRLIHGQVLVNWVRALGLSRLIVVDEGLAGDMIARSLLAGTVPRHIALWVGTAADLGSAAATFGEPADKQLLLIPSPRGALGVYDAGIHYLTLNVGCLGTMDGRVRLFPQVSLARAEYEILDLLASRGVEVISQSIPSASITRWPEIKARASRALS